MEILQIISLVGSIVLLVGLFRAHKYVVRTRLLPNLEEEHFDDEE
ncbi:hypothetical protein ACFQJ5_17580 [Halomicroarcula sp. GCM10025324]|jgi:hypothetical protein|nr:hypothetical protein [Halomicroarcula sp. ZS-22-S1]